MPPAGTSTYALGQEEGKAHMGGCFLKEGRDQPPQPSHPPPPTTQEAPKAAVEEGEAQGMVLTAINGKPIGWGKSTFPSSLSKTAGSVGESQ